MDLYGICWNRRKKGYEGIWMRGTTELIFIIFGVDRELVGFVFGNGLEWKFKGFVDGWIGGWQIADGQKYSRCLFVLWLRVRKFILIHYIIIRIMATTLI